MGGGVNVTGVDLHRDTDARRRTVHDRAKGRVALALRRHSSFFSEVLDHTHSAGLRSFHTRQQGDAMNATLDPIVIFHDAAICDGFGHEIFLTTDGITAYAEGSALIDTDRLWRNGETVGCFCPWQSENGCHGVVEWDLSTDGGWGAATPDLIRTLAYGAKVDLP